MALNSSGAISLGGSTAGQSVNLELGQAAGATITMNDTNLRSLFGVASGTISLSQGYGKSASASKGYFGGGRTSTLGWTTEISGVVFATDTSVDPAAVVTGRKTGTGWNTSSTGYWGAQPNPDNGPSVIASFNFSTEACATVNTDTSIATGVQVYPQNFMNSTVKGYRGFTGPSGGSIKGYTFSTNTVGSFQTYLVQGRELVGSVQSKATNKGYTAGGYNFNTPYPYTDYNQIDGLNFSNDTIIDPAAALAQARRGVNRDGLNSSTRGYWVGGEVGITSQTQIDGIQFSNEAAINPAAALGGGTNTSSVVSEQKSWMSTFPSTYSTKTMTNFVFSTESFTAASATFSAVNRIGGVGIQNAEGT
jgi:hypothetical protein